MILLYHKVAPDSPTMWWVTVDDFYRQLSELRGRRVVLLRDYDPADSRLAVITFDGVYENVLQFAAPLLAEFGYPFELFVSGDHIGRANDFDVNEPAASFVGEASLRRLVELGGRLQWHGRTHADLSRIGDRQRIVSELTVPEDIRTLDPAGFRFLAYPYGAFDEMSLGEARARFDGAVSCNQGDGLSPHQWNRVIVTNESRLCTRRISVIIPSFNYGRFLVEAAESALRQTIPADEILIADDCSTDDTEEIGFQLARQNPTRVRYVRRAKNTGIVANFNSAVDQTAGDYVCFLGADNRFVSNYLEECARILDEGDAAGIAYTDVALFGPRAEETYLDAFPAEWRGGVKHGFRLLRFPEPTTTEAPRAIRLRNFIHGSAMYRRDAFLAAGGYRERRGTPEDHDLFTRILDAGFTARKARRTLLEYRQHSTDQANAQMTSAIHLAHYQRRVRELEAELERLQRSFSWRVTLPFRVPMRAIRVFRSRGLAGLADSTKSIAKRLGAHARKTARRPRGSEEIRR